MNKERNPGGRRRVLLAVGSYPPGYGGAGLRAHKTYHRLRRRFPLEVQAATVAARGDRADCTEYEGVAIFETSSNRGFPAQFAALGRLLRQHGLRHFDVVHALGQSGVATAASAWALILGLPLVRELTVNEPISRSFGPVAFIRRLGFRRAALVIALNRGLKARLVEAGVDPGRIWERPNPVETTTFRLPRSAERQAARAAFGLPEGAPVHLLLGRLCPRKNQLFALDVLARLPGEHRLLLLGPVLQGDAPYSEKIASRIAALDLGNRVVFLPRHTDDPVQAYHAADVCWIPSVSEGMPNVLLEALVCGVPVVSNRGLELDEHIAEGVNGYACELEVSAFAAAARKAAERLDDAAARQQIAARSAERYGAEKIDAEFAARLAAIVNLEPREGPVTSMHTPEPQGDR